MKETKRLGLLLPFLVIPSACRASGAGAREVQPIATEDERLLEAVLAGTGEPGNRWVVVNESQPVPDWFPWTEHVGILGSDVPDDVQRDLLAGARTSRPFAFELDLPRVYRYVPRSEIDEIRRRGGFAGFWEAFYERFPGSAGYVELSTPGFGTERKDALLYVATHSDMLAGGGWFVRLAKEGDRWVVERRFRLWIA